jgi:hypothetical protein
MDNIKEDRIIRHGQNVYICHNKNENLVKSGILLV